MDRGNPNGGRRAACNNDNTYGNRGGGQHRNNKLDVSALGLVSPLGGGAGLSSLSALRQTVGVGGLGGLQQATQLGGLLGGGIALTGGCLERAGWVVCTPGRIAVTRRDFERDASPTSTTTDGSASGDEAEGGGSFASS